MTQHLLLTTFSHWVHADDLAQIQHSFARLNQGKVERVVFEARLRDIGGKDHWFIWIMTVSLTEGLVYGIGLEMPAREKNQVLLHNTEPHYREMINKLPQGILVYESDGKISLCNPTAEKLLGINAQQLIGQYWPFEMIHEDGTICSQLPHTVSAQDGKSYIEEIMGCRQSDNSLIWLSVSAHPLPSQHCIPPYAVVSTLTDISSRKRTYDSLRHEVILLSAVFETIKLSIAIIDYQGRFIKVNPAYCHLYGYKAEELLGRSFTLFLPSILHEKAINAHTDFFNNELVNNDAQWAMLHHDKTLISYSVTESKFQDYNGNFFRLIISNINTPADRLSFSTQLPSSQLLSSNELIDNERWIRLLIRQLPITILILDQAGQMIFVEGAHLDLLGLTKEKMRGKSIFQSKINLSFLENELRRALNGETFHQVTTYGGVNFKITYMPLLKINEWVGTLVVFHDITQQQKLKLRLENAVQEVDLLAAHTGVGFMYVKQQKIVRVTHKCSTLLGYSPAELLKIAIERLFRTLDDYICFQEEVGLQLSEKKSHQTCQWLRKKNSSYLYCQITIKPLNHSQSMLWLIEESRISESKPGVHTSLQKTLWKISKEALLVIDPYLRIRQANSASASLTGYSAAELINKSLIELSAGHQETIFYQHIIDELRQHGHWQGSIWQRHKNDTAYLCEIEIQAYDTEKESMIRYIARLTQKQTKDFGFLDTLTQLATPRLFYHKLHHTHAKARRNKKFFGLLMISLDDLATINSKHGAHVGDQLLQTLGNILKKSVRDSDTVARYGGASLAVILEDISKSEDAGLVSQMILFKLTQPVDLNKTTVQVTVSIGVVAYPNDGDEVDILLERAENAMQQAKQQGGCQCCFYEASF
jgi:diguanylate cyclase (GGDEF)-like protein/PAS domain S-box-containing protein